MSKKELLELTNRYLDEVWTQGNVDAFDKYYAEDARVGYPMPGVEPNREGLKQFARMMRSAFPDLETRIEETFADDDRVVQRWRTTGTHKGELFGQPATGREVNIHGISVYEIKNGRIQADWTIGNLLGLLQQLDLAPDLSTPEMG